jgi:metal-responsive CopG/Arc/MetJ family transcriptional regulator
MIKTLADKEKKLKKPRSRTVRKTITLDGDLASEFDTFVLESGLSEKIAINKLIRLGLIHEKELAERKNSEFSLPSFPKSIGKISRRELNTLLDEI